MLFAHVLRTPDDEIVEISANKFVTEEEVFSLWLVMLMKRFAELLLPLKSQYLMNIELTNCQLMKPRMPQALMKKNPMKKKLLMSQLKILVEAQTLELFM